MMRHVFETMGTTASLIAGRSVPIADVEQVFADADRRFSLYRADSELSRIASGALLLQDAGTAIRHSYAAAAEWRNRTDGAFSPNRPDGVIDLNGIVKAQAMQDAADMLDDAGDEPWTLVVGGDLVASSARPDRQPWTTGIVDPGDRGALVCSVELHGSRRAIATSGSAERGDHIWLGGSLEPADYVQATVIADDIVTADVLATAIIAGGRASLGDFCDRWPIDVLTIDRAGDLRATPGFSAALVRRSPNHPPGCSMPQRLGVRRVLSRGMIAP